MANKKNMSRRKFLASVGAGAASMAALPHLVTAQEGQQERPNIVLLMADDMGSECLNSYGGVSYSTPNLTRLAESGIQFNHCYSQGLCTPSRVKIMTGKQNARNYTRFGCLPPGEPTFAQTLKQAGYKTCVVGKWQLAGRTGGEGTYPAEAGFDDWCLWHVDHRGPRYADPLIRKKGQDEAHKLEGEYGPDVFFDYMREFIMKNKEEPFLIYYPMCLTHNPKMPTPDSEGWPGNRKEQDDRYFADMVAYTDKQVGRIDAELGRMGLRDNTILMFTTDNGSPNDIRSELENGRVVRGGKHTLTQAGTHAPLVVSWPGRIRQRGETDALVDFSDFLPTLADLGEGELPDGHVIDGHSFAPILRGDGNGRREWVALFGKDKGKPSGEACVLDGTWKLYNDGRLYNVVDDPDEQVPIPPGEGGDEATAARKRLRPTMDWLLDLPAAARLKVERPDE